MLLQFFELLMARPNPSVDPSDVKVVGVLHLRKYVFVLHLLHHFQVLRDVEYWQTLWSVHLIDGLLKRSSVLSVPLLTRKCASYVHFVSYV